MTQILVTGNLLNPLGEPTPNTEIRLTALGITGEVVTDAVALHKTDKNGYYEFDLMFGQYSLEVNFDDEYVLLVDIIVDVDTPNPISITDLVQYSPIKPTSIVVPDDPIWVDKYNALRTAADVNERKHLQQIADGEVYAATKKQIIKSEALDAYISEEVNDVTSNNADIIYSKSAYSDGTNAESVIDALTLKTSDAIFDSVTDIHEASNGNIQFHHTLNFTDGTNTVDNNLVIEDGSLSVDNSLLVDGNGLLTQEEITALKTVSNSSFVVTDTDLSLMGTRSRVADSVLKDIKLSDGVTFAFEGLTGDITDSSHLALVDGELVGTKTDSLTVYDKNTTSTTTNDGFVTKTIHKIDEVSFVNDDDEELFNIDTVNKEININGRLVINNPEDFKGEKGDSQYFIYQYAETNSVIEADWHEVYVPASDRWRRQAEVFNGVQGAWSDGFLLNAVDGAAGDTYYIEYNYSDDKLDWHAVMQDGDIWRRERIIENGVPTSTWSEPARIRGADGIDADLVLLEYQYAVKGTDPENAWHYNFITGDHYRRERYVYFYSVADRAAYIPTANDTWYQATIWSNVAKIVPEDGIDYGYKHATIFLYQNAIDAPVAPTADITYNFLTLQLAGLTEGWVENIPEGNGDVWIAVASAWTLADSDTIAPNEWVVERLAAVGRDGVTGMYTSYIYINASVAPTSVPNEGSFNGTTEIIPTGYTDNPVTPNAGEATYVSVGRYEQDSETEVWSRVSNWSVPARFSGFVGDTIYYEYQHSADNISWHDDLLATDYYKRQRTVTVTDSDIVYGDWTDGVLIRIDGQPGEPGEDGIDGANNWTVFEFSPTNTGTPDTNPEIWSSTQRSTDAYLISQVYLDGVAQGWSEVTRIKGLDGTNGVDGQDGAAGVNGEDGVSIIFKGTYASHPANPENGWSYYNSTDKKSYVRQSGSWYQMTIDGLDGVNGQDGADGLSIVFKGDLVNPPSNPVLNWAYRDTDNGYVYIYNGSAWELMVADGSDGVDGAAGDDGLSVYITYHSNSASVIPSTPTGAGTSNGWSTVPDNTRVWMSQKVATDASSGTWGSPIRIRGLDGYVNLLRNDSWVIGTSGSQGVFSQNGRSNENIIISDIGPMGISEAIWHATGGDNSSDGGWNAHVYNIDHTRTYRHCVWMKSSGTSLSNYFGCGQSTTKNLLGSQNQNPYHWNGDLPQMNKWYLVVGIIHGSGYSGTQSGISGVYDPVTGNKVMGGTDYQNIIGATSQSQRTYRFYVTDTNHESWFARPRFEEVNGEELSLEEIMGRKALAGTNGTDGIDGLDGNYVSYVYTTTSTTSAPSTPTNGSYNGSVETVPTNWTDDPVFIENKITWVSSVKYAQQSNGTWSRVGTWSTPTKWANTGKFFETRYAGSSGTPTTPTGTEPSGWFVTPPTVALPQRVWASTCTKHPTGELDVSWSSPVPWDGYTPQKGVDYVDGNPNNHLELITTGTATVDSTGQVIGKVAGLDSWDSSIYSSIGYTGGCVATVVVGSTNAAWMMGLNDTPTASSSYTDITFCFYIQNNGTLAAYESGASKSLSGVSYSIGDTLSVIYDNEVVRYLHNGNVLREVATSRNRKFYFDTAIHNNATASYTKAIAFTPMGAAGQAGSFVSFVYKLSNTSSTPSGGSYDGTTEVIPSGWSDNPVYSTSTKTQVSTCRYVKNGLTWSRVPEWSTSVQYLGQDGAEGLDGNYISYVYKNASSVPATPSGGSYNGSSETVPSGWADNPTSPTGTNKTWISSVRYSVNAAGVWSRLSNWSTPIQWSGENGYQSATVFLYQVKSTTPSLPTASITYTFATGTVDSGDLTNGWSATVPNNTSAGGKIWVTFNTAFAQVGNATDELGTGNWSTPTVFTQNGVNGQTSYFHIAYADSATGSGFSQSPTGKDYIGTYIDFNATDSVNPGSYNWQLVKGAQGSTGAQGIAGTNGSNGQTSYLHIAYANNSTGSSGFSVSDATDKLYIGQYTDFNINDSTNPSAYSWTKIKGDQGIQGLQGLQGAKGDQGIPGVNGLNGTNGNHGQGSFIIQYNGNSDSRSNASKDADVANIAGRSAQNGDLINYYWDSTSGVGKYSKYYLRSSGSWSAINFVVNGDAVIEGTIAAEALKTNSVTADKIVAGAVNASKLAANSVTAEKLSINTTGNESGNGSGAAIIMDAYNQTPLQIVDKNTGKAAFSVSLVEGEQQATVNGSAGDNFINSIQAISVDVRKTINPYYLEGAKSTVTSSSTTSSTSVPTSSIATGGRVDLSYTITNTFNGTASGQQWLVQIYRGGSASGSLIWIKRYNGDGFISATVGFTDSSPAASQQYTFKITREAGSGTAFISGTAEGSGLLTNSFTGSPSIGYWRDKETGFARRWGYVNTGNASGDHNTVNFYQSFTTCYGVSITTVTTRNNGGDFPSALWTSSSTGKVSSTFTNRYFRYTHSTNSSGIIWEAWGHVA